MTAKEDLKMWFIDCSRACVAGAPVPVTVLCYGGVPNPFLLLSAYILFLLVYVLAHWLRYRHLERMEVKKNELQRDILAHEANEAEKSREFQRERSDKLLAHARRTKQQLDWDTPSDFGRLQVTCARAIECVQPAARKATRGTRVEG
jgi:hypothetical protein